MFSITAYSHYENGELVPAPSSVFYGTEKLSRVRPNGLNSIKADKYICLVNDISNISLIEKQISNKTVEKIYLALKDLVLNPYRYPEIVVLSFNIHELTELKNWFEAVYQYGYFIGATDE